MKRKVIQLAEKTHVISLPNAWVRKYGIQKSDELSVKEKDNILMVSTEGGLAVPERTTVDISGLDEELVKSIVSVLHKVGYDEIEFIFDNAAIMPAIHRRVRELIGFEIIEQSQKRCVLKNVSGDLPHELDNMVRRTFRVTLAIANESFQLIQQGRFSELEGLLHLEKTNNRLSNYCHRILNKHSKGPQSVFLYTILWLLESIADDYRDICVLLSEKDSVSEEVLALFGQVNTHLDNYYNYFYKKNHDGMAELRAENKKLKKELVSSKKISSDADLVVVVRLFDLVQRVYDCFGSTTGTKFIRQHAESSR